MVAHNFLLPSPAIIGVTAFNGEYRNVSRCECIMYQMWMYCQFLGGTDTLSLHYSLSNFDSLSPTMGDNFFIYAHRAIDYNH